MEAGTVCESSQPVLGRVDCDKGSRGRKSVEVVPRVFALSSQSHVGGKQTVCRIGRGHPSLVTENLCQAEGWGFCM